MAGPDSSRALVEQAGLDFRPFDAPPEDEVGALLGAAQDLPRAEADVLMGGELYGRLKPRAALPGMLAEVEAWRPDAIVREGYELASSLVAELHGIPHVRAATGLASTEDWVLSFTAAGGLPNLPVDRIRASPYLTPDAAGAGRPPRRPPVPGPAPATPRRRCRTGGRASTVRSCTSRSARWPAGCRCSRRSTGRPSGSSPTCRCACSSRSATPAIRPSSARCRRTSTSSAGCRRRTSLPHAAAMVCHGGYGTTTGALAHGVPLVVVPMFADQPRNALRVAEIGAGIALPAPASLRAVVEHATEALAGLGDLVQRLLDEPRYARAARRVAESARALPPVDAAADVLAAIAGEEVSARGGGRAVSRRGVATWRRVDSRAMMAAMV